MSPTKEEVLVALQTKIAQARDRHEDLVARHRIMVAMNYKASAAKLADQVDKAFSDLEAAKAALQRHTQKEN